MAIYQGQSLQRTRLHEKETDSLVADAQLPED